MSKKVMILSKFTTDLAKGTCLHYTGESDCATTGEEVMGEYYGCGRCPVCQARNVVVTASGGCNTNIEYDECTCKSNKPCTVHDVNRNWWGET